VLPREGREGPPLQEPAVQRSIFISFRGPKALSRSVQRRTLHYNHSYPGFDVTLGLPSIFLTFRVRASILA
jgi:hypothetical protein